MTQNLFAFPLARENLIFILVIILGLENGPYLLSVLLAVHLHTVHIRETTGTVAACKPNTIRHYFLLASSL